MNNLIIINGPCGVGKSTAAKHLHDALPLSYLVDVDAIGRNISHYREYQEERWELREAVAFATVDAVLTTKRDAIVEKMIFDETILDRYRDIASTYDANVHELILWMPKDALMERAHARGWREGGLLTPEKCESFWHKIDVLKGRRPEARVIDISGMDEQRVLEEILARIT